MENSGFVICMLIGMVVGYFVLKLLATKYFIRLYRETGKNMITKPRQLLGFVTGISFLVGIVAVCTGEIMLGESLGTVLMLVGCPLIFCLLMALLNKSVGGKHIVLCTLYQIALGICFVGRLLVWIVEISLELGRMINFGGTAKFTWHPFFFTIIDRDGNVVEKNKANVVMNEDGAFEGAANTAARIEKDMNNARINQNMRQIEKEIEQEKVFLDEAISEGGTGVEEQQRIDDLEDQYDALAAQRSA